MAMTTSARGRAALIHREGCRLAAYRDPVGVWTIGVGHTGRAAPPAVVAGMVVTAAEAETILTADLKPFERAVAEAVARPLTQNQFDACVSLAFNVGGGAFRTSSVARFASEGRMAEAADAFLLWTKAGGAVLDGLIDRRRAERATFLTPDAPFDRVPVRVAAPPGLWNRVAALFRRGQA